MVDETARTGKAEFRLTNDLSWPKPSAMKGVSSLNDSMDRSNWSGAKLIKVSQVGEGIAILKASGANVKAWGFDMSAYYLKFGRRPDELWHQAMYGSNGSGTKLCMVPMASNWIIDVNLETRRSR